VYKRNVYKRIYDVYLINHFDNAHIVLAYYTIL